MNNMERQRQIESDSVRDGCLRWCQNIEYQQATDDSARCCSEVPPTPAGAEDAARLFPSVMQ